MSKKILKSTSILLVLFILLIIYLSSVGIETEKFNKQIKDIVKQKNNKFDTSLKKIRLTLDLLNFRINAKTIDAKITFKGKSIELEYIKTQISLNSLIKSQLVTSEIEISTKPILFKNFVSFTRAINNRRELFFLEQFIKKGYLIADLKFNFDEFGILKDDYKVNGLIKAFSNNPQTIEVEKKSLTVDTIEQTYYEVRSRSKIEVLSRLLDMETEPKGIVFCNTKQMVEEASEVLSLRGYLADKIHGDITQSNRERVMKRFREGKVEILVATDVAARGLDIEEVGIVFNYDLPYDPEDYVHRIGRTGRAGKSGKSITFIYGRDIHNLEAIERYTNQPIKRMKIPSQEEVEGKKADSVLNKVRDKLESKDFANYEHYFDRLLDVGHTASDISSVLFDLLGNQENREMQTITEDSEPYSAERKRFSSRDSSFKSRRNGRRRGGRFQSKNSDDRDQIHVPHKHKRKRKSSKVRKDKGKPNRSKRSKVN